MVKLLLDRGAKIDAKTRVGVSLCTCLSLFSGGRNTSPNTFALVQYWLYFCSFVVVSWKMTAKFFLLKMG